MGSYSGTLRSLQIYKFIIGMSLTLASLGCLAEESYKVTFYNKHDRTVKLTGPGGIQARTKQKWDTLSTCMSQWNLPSGSVYISPGGSYSFTITDINGAFTNCHDGMKSDTWVVDVNYGPDGSKTSTTKIVFQHYKYKGYWVTEALLPLFTWPGDPQVPQKNWITNVTDGHGRTIGATGPTWEPPVDIGPPEEFNVYIGW